MELKVDKIQLMQLNQWVLEDEGDKEGDEMEEGEEVEVEKELPELAKRERRMEMGWKKKRKQRSRSKVE